MKVSIITPTFNRVSMLKQAIASVLVQSYQDWELIIKDGYLNKPAINDSEFSELISDKRIVYITESDTGISEALNQAISKATGDIMVEMNDDDMLYDADVLTDVVKQFDSNFELQWLYSKMETITNEGQPIQIIGRETTLAEMLMNNLISQPTVFWRTSFLKQIGQFDEQFPYAQDYELWIRFFKASQPLFFNRITAKYRLHNSQTTNTQRALQDSDAARIREKHKA